MPHSQPRMTEAQVSMMTGKVHSEFPGMTSSDYVTATGHVNVSIEEARTLQGRMQPGTSIVSRDNSLEAPNRFTGRTSLRNGSAPFGDSSMLIMQNNTTNSSKVGIITET